MKPIVRAIWWYNAWVRAANKHSGTKLSRRADRHLRTAAMRVATCIDDALETPA